MATVTTPTFTPSAVVSPATVTPGSLPVTRGTIDLSAVNGAYLQARIGYTNSIDWDAPLSIQIRPMGHPSSVQSRTGSVTAATGNSVIATCSIGDMFFNVATGGSAFAAGDLIMLQNGGGGFTRLEFHRVAKVVSNTIHIDSPLVFGHISADNDVATNAATVFPEIWLPGGKIWEVIFDPGAATVGSNVVVLANAITFTDEETV